MSDIQKNNSLIPMTSDLEKKHVQIQINEKKSLIRALGIRLDDLVNVEAKKLQLQIEKLTLEIEHLSNEFAIEIIEDTDK